MQPMLTLVGPKWAENQQTFIFARNNNNFKGAREPRVIQEKQWSSEPGRLGGSPLDACLEVWGVWRVGN